MAQYFRIEPNPQLAGAWFLSDPRSDRNLPIDPRAFTEGRLVDGDKPASVNIRVGGPQLDFNFGAFDMVVARTEVVDKLQAKFDVPLQRFAVSVGEETGYEVVNVLDRIPCFDRSASVFTTKEGDGDPLRMVVKLRIVTDRARGHHMFRLDEWPTALIVSEDVKRHFEVGKITGVVFSPV
jgi:hypothetical protein